MMIINLFLTPFTGLSLFLRRNKLNFHFSAKTFELYVLFVSWNIPFTRGLSIVAKKINIAVPLESGYYTLFSLLSSILVFLCAVLITEVIHISFKLEKKK